jgi:cell wall-associated NlpC family hydrolase
VASHRRVRGRPSVARAAGLVAVTVAAAGLVPAIAHADPFAGAGGGAAGGAGPDSPGAVKQQVADLYRQAEAETQQYDATEERIARLQAAVAGSGTRTAQLRTQLNAATASLGRLAAEQYRDSGMSPAMALVFSTHPDSYLERAGMTDRMAAVEQQRVAAALAAQQALDALQRESAGNLADLRTAQIQLAAHRADIEARLTAARARLDSLGSAERGTVTAALAQGGGDGLGTPVAAGAAPSLSSLLAAITKTAVAVSGSDAGAAPQVARSVQAVAAAYSELGKPYVWGATGPGQFDCSGLTQHVWAAAGVRLPRTSQEQADAGPSVPVASIRPGDLVVYFSGQTHIGIYVGQGLVIHAPRPGAVVQFAPLDSMPIDKVVRPAH